MVYYMHVLLVIDLFFTHTLSLSVCVCVYVCRPCSVKVCGIKVHLFPVHGLFYLL